MSSATPPSFSDVNDYKNKTIKKLKEVDEDLASFNNKGDETDVKAIMNQIETAMNNAKASEGKARFADFEGASQGSVLAELKDYNKGKNQEREEKIENLDSESKGVLEQARWDYENGELDKSTLEAIITGLITGGSGFLENLMKNKQADELSSEDAEKVAEWGADNRVLFLDPKTMLKEQEELGFEGEKGGYETEEVWSINLQINQQKHAQLTAQSEGDNKAEQEAKDKEKQLREKYADLSAHLIKEDEPPHVLPNEQLQLENGDNFNYRVDSEGHLHYEGEPGYEYYEEAHKQSAGQQVQGVLAKTVFTSLVGWGTGSLVANASLKSQAGMSILGGTTGAGSELLGPNKYNVLYVPSTDEVKTMIYRTNKNGETENLVIDSQGKEILKNSGWNDY
ncbi:hypothetical protein J2Z83_003939 [Virgibacillus natechei]|uniref:LXG domain-containing protein n=1 Tax=Virgibacillus natechei TaxID=1216297 RepID=A0ABS4IP45_9BACI|nr:hypothetical protein [Virgibacillus natechei]